MKGYDYRLAMMGDVSKALNELIEFYGVEILEDEDKIYDSMWIDDSVTGNGSGSYTFNSSKAKDYVLDNVYLLKDALCEFECLDSYSINDTVDKFLSDNWEYFDVTIRCYLLGEILYPIIEKVKKAAYK